MASNDRNGMNSIFQTEIKENEKIGKLFREWKGCKINSGGKTARSAYDMQRCSEHAGTNMGGKQYTESEAAGGGETHLIMPDSH